MAANFHTFQLRPKFKNISPMSLLLNNEFESTICRSELSKGRANNGGPNQVVKLISPSVRDHSPILDDPIKYSLGYSKVLDERLDLSRLWGNNITLHNELQDF